MPAMRRASSATPASDWLMTAVGPPPCATRIFPDDIRVSLSDAAVIHCQPDGAAASRQRTPIRRGRAVARGGDDAPPVPQPAQPYRMSALLLFRRTHVGDQRARARSEERR